MRNFVTETELKGYVPELVKYLWTGETNYTKQKGQAEQIVYSDLLDKGYALRTIQVPLELTDESVEDTNNGLRWVVTPSAGTGDVILYGSNDNETWTEVETLAFSSTAEQTYLLSTTYKYYYIDSDITCQSFLYETGYDLLFAFKWLELILMNAVKNEGDQYHIKAQYFMDCYNSKINGMAIAVDEDLDGEVDKTSSGSIINLTR